MVLVFLAVLAGMVLPVQAGVNAALARQLGSTAQAAFVSFVVGLLVMLVFCLASRQNFPALRQLSAVPPYTLIGGLLGGIMVMTTIILAPKIGAVALVSALLAGQLICSIVLDHQGWVGFSIHPVNGMRIFGILLLISGVYLVNRF